MDITNKIFPFLCSLSWSILTLKLNFQDFIKDNKQSVAKYVKSVNKDLTVTGYKRAALG